MLSALRTSGRLIRTKATPSSGRSVITNWGSVATAPPPLCSLSTIYATTLGLRQKPRGELHQGRTGMADAYLCDAVRSPWTSLGVARRVLWPQTQS
jgi:hypothetical protein